jgi:hypothetical protein
VNIFDRWTAGHKARNDSPAYDDLKPQADKLPADWGLHPLWCHRAPHDGPCVDSTAVTDPNGRRVKFTVTVDPGSSEPPTVTVEVGGQAATLDAETANAAAGRLAGLLSEFQLPQRHWIKR